MRRRVFIGVFCIAALAAVLWSRNTSKKPVAALPSPSTAVPKKETVTKKEDPPAEEVPAQAAGSPVETEDPLAQLQGVWQEESGLVLTFSGSTLTFGPQGQPGQTVEVRAIRNEDTGEIHIVAKDPQQEGVGDFGPIVFRDGTIHTSLPFVRES